jgi:thermitase
MYEQPTNPAEALAKKPIRFAVAAIAIAIMFSLAVNSTVHGVYNLIAYYQTIITTEQQLAAAAIARTKTATTPAAEVLETKAPVESDRIIVKYKADAKLPSGLTIAAERANLEKAQGLVKVLTINGIDAEVYQVSEADTAREVVDRLLATKSDLIEYAEVDMLVPPSFIPDDPSYGSQWHHPKIGTPIAWDSVQGEGVTVAILDSGVDCTHPDLKESCVTGWNFYDNNSNTSDVYGHGTKVAGAAMAIGNNAIGVAGVAPKAKLMPVRIAGTDGYGSASAMAQGMAYAADNGARVANLSFGYICGYQSLLDAANYMRTKGAVAIFAGGNYNTDQGNTQQNSDVTCVSATDGNDAKTSWSSFGIAIDVAAPGVSIYTTTNGGGYAGASGTSLAAPVTAGIYALMFSANPALTPTQADNLLFSTADDLGTAGWDMYYGHGRVNAEKAVAAALATIGTRDAVAPSVPTNLRTTDLKSTSVTLAWNASTDDNSGVAGYSIYRNGTKLTTVAGTAYTSTNLTANTTYTYTVRAEDAQGNSSADSTPLSVTTPDVSFGIISYAVPTKTATGATISATLAKAGTVTVKYGTTNTNLNLSASSATAATTHSVPLSSLAANTTYYYQIVATDGTTTVSSPVSSFKTSKTTGKPVRR